MKPILLLLLLLSCTGFSSVRIIDKSGWTVNIQIEPRYLVNHPLVFLVYNQNFTNTEFLLDNGGNYTVKLDLLDGIYNYIIQDFNKAVIEKGRLSLIKAPRINRVLNRPAAGTFTRFPESRFVNDSTPAVNRINDGIIEWLKGMAVSGEINSADQTAFINLQATNNLKEINIYWHAGYFPFQYSFYYSLDGINWLSIPRSTNSMQQIIALDNTPVMLDTLSTNIQAAYIGIVVSKDTPIKSRSVFRNYLELLEIEAYE